MFEQAVRMKLRFPFKGQIGVEELWDLPLTALDNLFKTLNAQAKVANEESLLATRSDADKVLELQINIIKHIVAVKLAEAEARKTAATNRERKAKLMDVLAAKQDAALNNLTPEQLQQMIAELS